MFNIKRLAVAMSLFGMGLVAVACTSPADEGLAQQPTAEEGADVTTADEPLADEETATHSSTLAVEDGALASDDVQLDDRALLRHDRRRVCDYRDAWHCRRGQRGWRWVSYGRDGRGDDRDWRRRGSDRRSERCCVRYGGRPRW